ncbi:Uma2 family endonuclease [Alienimonas californiensis]|uniref:Putative restriction endonuclease domain-containing protein n=1 Tax=Alienimonas californiensis TaxID=2527989 RepID=A0A517PF49_9PLAN|nr:Uma2 family endonuclease [Alienimonas californiensis]QDT17984.1 hypothetical protein CA12_41220 [Alienimonas californiensis]
MTAPAVLPSSPASGAAVPPLRHGDRLRWDEYIRRYEAMPEDVRAELLAGEVQIMSPLRHRPHGQPHRIIETWLGMYQARTPGVDGGTASTVRLTDVDGPEPDSILRLLPECGGASTETSDDYLAGTPELFVEIGAATASRDLNEKRERYRLAGVREYLVFAPLREQLHWLVLNEAGEYERLRPRRGGVIRSRTFPGLWLNVPALTALDFAAVLDTLAEGMGTAEHAAFAASNRGKLDAGGDPG